MKAAAAAALEGEREKGGKEEEQSVGSGQSRARRMKKTGVRGERDGERREGPG